MTTYSRILTTILFSISYITLNAHTIITEVSKLSPTRVDKILKPKSIEELQNIVKTTDKPISIAGARCSQGGQIAYQDGIVVDTTALDNVLALNPIEKTVTVQTGITWKKLIKCIDPYHLSIKAMQSYSDFTVGGTLGVNAHGRSLDHEPLINTIQALKIIDAEGNLIEASRTQNSEYFYAAIGGYGLVGVVVEVTLELLPSAKIKSDVTIEKVNHYKKYFYNHVLPDKKVRLHSAYLCPANFDRLITMTWRETNEPVSTKDHIRNNISYLDNISVQLSRYPAFRALRTWLAQYTRTRSTVIYQNYEMSDTIRSLEPIFGSSSTSILQEYFIPVENFEQFIKGLKYVVNKYNVNLLNVGIRYVTGDTESALPYAPKESFAFVLFIDVPKSQNQNHNILWTRELVNQALKAEGRYYLPYHLYPTKDQLFKSYPELHQFLAFKKKVDPTAKFRNSLFKKYFEA